MGNNSNSSPPEFREHPVRRVYEPRGEYATPWVVDESIAPRIGCVRQTLNEWVRILFTERLARTGIEPSMGGQLAQRRQCQVTGGQFEFLYIRLRCTVDRQLGNLIPKVE